MNAKSDNERMYEILQKTRMGNAIHDYIMLCKPESELPIEGKYAEYLREMSDSQNIRCLLLLVKAVDKVLAEVADKQLTITDHSLLIKHLREIEENTHE